MEHMMSKATQVSQKWLPKSQEPPATSVTAFQGITKRATQRSEMASDSTNQLVTLLRRCRKRRMARHTSALPSSVLSTRAPSRHPVSARSTRGPAPSAALPIGGAAPQQGPAPLPPAPPASAAPGCGSGRPRGHLCPLPSVCPRRLGLSRATHPPAAGASPLASRLAAAAPGARRAEPSRRGAGAPGGGEPSAAERGRAEAPGEGAPRSARRARTERRRLRCPRPPRSRTERGPAGKGSRARPDRAEGAFSTASPWEEPFPSPLPVPAQVSGERHDLAVPSVSFWRLRSQPG